MLPAESKPSATKFDELAVSCNNEQLTRIFGCLVEAELELEPEPDDVAPETEIGDTDAMR